ncbi:hypothetical protein E1176_17750 [Fulvivirga sp. RKSG066]|uniref:hypothetical protein n=1 Tax=Fulvivirga aurantia TaxID=2529383 RepID=UPI0012BD2005|nr:hypothetical protein [Fulvivirga aurantia]MTI22881.1 hypothetical protein [Fulvivirga aurantia]
MEYSFKINESGKERTLILKNEMIIYVLDDAIYEVPYKNITAVWLNKPGGFCTPSSYSCTLNIKDDKPIFITSKNWDLDQREILQQNHYNSFVRVLHMHLKEKSKATYGFGVKPQYYMLRVAAIITILTLATYLSVNYQLNNFLLAIPVAISLFVLTCGLNFCVKNFPSSYRPDHIPITLLPAQS